MEENYHVKYDPKNECIVTIGVSEALDIAMRALVNPGDEVIYTEPCFVSYPAEIRMAHGVPVVVETYAKDGFALDPEILLRKITPKSRALLLNFPCNPTGAVMSRENLEKVAEIAVEHDLIVLTDEIYSELLYEDRVAAGNAGADDFPARFFEGVRDDRMAGGLRLRAAGDHRRDDEGSPVFDHVRVDDGAGSGAGSVAQRHEVDAADAGQLS